MDTTIEGRSGVLRPPTLVRVRPLQQRLLEQLRELIASGRLQSSTRIPSTRMLAEQVVPSRKTVLLTCERLVAAGCLETISAHGTLVSHFGSAAINRTVGAESPPERPTASAQWWYWRGPDRPA